MTKEYVEDGRLHILQDKHIPDYVTVIRIHGPFLFGTTETSCRSSPTTSQTLSPVVILRLRNMTAIDATGLLALEDLADKLHAAGRILILCGARPQPAKLMHQAEFERHVGRENICPNIAEALKRARELFESTPRAGKQPGSNGDGELVPAGHENRN